MKNKNVRVGVGVIVSKNNKILMIKRINSHGAGTWSTPGGHLDFGEDPVQCAIRECKEETDIDITNVKFKCITNDIFDEGKHYITVWMQADYLSGKAKVNALNELNEIGWYEWESLPLPLFQSMINLTNGDYYINE